MTTAPERKCGKSKWQNENRKKHHGNRRPQSPANQHFDLPVDLTQEMLTFVSFFDLSTIRCVNTKLRNLTSTDNIWTRNMLVSRITPPRSHNQRSPFEKVILLVTKTRQYGTHLHQAACKMKRQGPITDALFYGCAAAVFSHETGNHPNAILDGPEAWHLLNMSCNLGMEVLTGAYLLTYLKKKGLDEKNMTEDGRRSVRKDYLKYRKKFAKDGVRLITNESCSYFLEEVDNYDLGSHAHIFEKSKDDDEAEQEEEPEERRVFPPCEITTRKSSVVSLMDPLAMMTTARNGEMARRIIRLFMDLENGVPPETAKHCRLAVQFYFQAAMTFSDPDDVEMVQLIVSNVYNVEPHQTQKCSWVLMNFTKQVRPKEMEKYAERERTIHGYDKQFDYDEWVQNRFVFAREMIPFAISKINLQLMKLSLIDELTLFLESEGNPMVEHVALRDEVKRLISPFVARFVI